MANKNRGKAVLHPRSVNTSTIPPSMNSKRKIEVIDLVDSDDETTNPTRKAARADNQPGIYSQSDRDTWVISDDDDTNELIHNSQDGGLDDGFDLYGTLQTKIVGVRYYNGYATMGEHVLIKREPGNQYDENAIRIDNVQRTQIGHLPRQIAAKLASYVDNGSLFLSGRIAGHKGEYDCPVEVELYGPSDPAAKAQLARQMKSDRLPVDELRRQEAAEKELVAADKRRRAAELKKVPKKGAGVAPSTGGGQQWELGSSQSDFVGISSQGLGEASQSIEDFVLESERFNPREMGQVVEKYGAQEECLAQMPMAEQPGRLSTGLLSYQRQGLAWLQDRENPEVPAPGSTDVVQLWKRSERNATLFTNIATNYTTKEPPELARAGILADDMGLGKTLEMIALIVADMESTGYARAQSQSKATLIVAPVSVMSNWSSQIAHHVQKDKALRVLTYHGSSRKALKPGDFAEYDVVITTYGTLSAEYLPQGAKKSPAPIPRATGLFSVHWRRLLLDEGHMIRNPGTKGALAATSILARSRFVLTGTPIINSLKDLYSLVRFIGLRGGLQQLEIFNHLLIRPLKHGSESATLLLQALMGTLCLRRRKDMSFIDLRLPELSEYVHRVKFLPQEKEKYDALQAEAKGLLQTYHNRQGKGDGRKAQDAYRHLLEILLRLRQVCNHWKLCGDRVISLMSLLESQKVVELTPGNCQALQEMLQLSIESREDCPVCLENLHNHDPVITHCGHVFGLDCISRVIETQHKCPMCRAELKDEKYLVQPATETGDSKEETINVDTTSSKIETLLTILKASHRKSGTKTIIFSQWTSFLDIVQRQLDEHQYGYARIDGRMPATARDQALHALDSDPNCTILLASLGVCAVGLNLVAASQVILMDSWWAPAIEDQAVDRVHRLGQKKETTVFRLVMEGSIEERTLEIQQEKRKLMMTAFQEKKSKRMGGRSARLGDIEKLLK